MAGASPCHDSWDALSATGGSASNHGHGRVSTTSQDASHQHDALAAAGCARLWIDVAFSSRDDRPQLTQLLERLLPGDTLTVWRLDRLGRSLPHLLATVNELEGRGGGYRSLTESIDTSTAGGLRPHTGGDVTSTPVGPNAS